MRSRLTTKYMAETFFIIVISFVGLAAVYYGMAYQYTQQRQMRQLTSVSELVCEAIHDSGARSQESARVAQMLAKSADCHVVVLEETGDLLLSLGNDQIPKPEELGSETLRMLAAPEGYEGQLTGLYEQPELASARSTVVKGKRYIVVSSALPDSIETTINALMRIFTTASYGVLAVTLLAVYFTTNRLTRPLKSMSYAARRFGQGHFDVRVRVNGDDEMAELATAFNNMADSLDKNERMRTSFIANISHDLKTPMTTISGFVDGILDGTIPPELQSHYLELVSDETRRLSRLVNTLLDLAKFESDEVEFRIGPFDLCETVRQVLISFERNIGDKELLLNLDLHDEVITARGDSDAIHRVVYNIVDNAVKFTPQGGELSITLEKRDRQAICTIRNSGEGVPPADLPHLFDRFYKTDKSRSLDRRGSGLGLYIAKTVIDRHGGTIRAESEQGSYCSIIFTLPLYLQRSGLPSISGKTRGDRNEEPEGELPQG
ncbi:MAG: HAMP domain-containing protein [Clostridia bacterium]|nr:HAMP domain-containing protein [Clostridia bacterium]